MTKALLEHEAKQLLADHGIPVLPFRFCTTEQELLRGAEELGYPVVIKVVSHQIVHKSEAGGVRLNLKDSQELLKAYTEMMSSVRAYDPSAHIDGVLVSPFLKGAREIIVGSTYDAQFGPTVMAGLGGIFVEIFKDVSFGIAPVNLKEAREMLSSLKAYPLLEGARGESGIDIESLARLIAAVSRLVMEIPVQELDLNPVFCFSDRVMAADARILLRD